MQYRESLRLGILLRKAIGRRSSRPRPIYADGIPLVLR